MKFNQRIYLSLVGCLTLTSLAVADTPNTWTLQASSPRCSVPDERNANPDDIRWWEWVDPSGLGAVYRVMFYGNQSTDRIANYGIKAYMGDSVASDRPLYESAIQFYSWLKDLEAQRRLVGAHMSPIQTVAGQDQASPPIWDSALAISESNPYRALKLLALFGHDNLENDLLPGHASARNCRIGDLNQWIPLPESPLYLNGAIPALQYGEAWVQEGQQIAQSCWRAAESGVGYAYGRFCNNRLRDYQADYYHVIASAFLGCRRRVAQNHLVLRGKAMSWIEPVILDRYLEEVKKYKVARFYEEMTQAEAEEGIDTPEKRAIAILVRKNLHSLSERGVGRYPDREELATLGPEAQNLVIAVIHRQEFEVRFRMEQHRMGMSFGYEACAGVSTF